MKRILTLVTKAILALLATLVLFLVLAFIVVPKIMGWVPLTVLTGSMQPHLPPGTEIVVKPVESADDLDALKVGDVASYMPLPNDPTLITHRIISIAVRADGERVFTFQGDANPSPDPVQVKPQQIKGKLLYYLPWVGYLAHAVPQSGKGVGLLLVAVGLLGYALWQIVGAVRPRRRSEKLRRHSPEYVSAQVADVVDALDSDLDGGLGGDRDGSGDGDRDGSGDCEGSVGGDLDGRVGGVRDGSGDCEGSVGGDLDARLDGGLPGSLVPVTAGFVGSGS